MSRWTTPALLLAAIVSAVALRVPVMAERSPFIDEAESAINALTILQHGVPTASYLGLPIYENTLTEPWPESPEYEFRDTSYSPRGLATYHGWLPLYAIAAACWLLGIAPDEAPAGEVPAIRTLPEIEARVLAARVPSAVFAAGFVVALFLAGRSTYGVDAGLAAAWAGALSTECVDLGSQARYYSATLALSTLAGWTVWRLRDRELRRDWLFAAIALAALFHTHLLAFAVVLALLVPRLVRSLWAGRAAVVLPAMGLLAAASVPWLVLSGYLEGRVGGPRARELLDFPQDYWAYFAGRRDVTAGLGGVAVIAGGLWLLRERLPPRARQALGSSVPGLGYCAAWLAIAYFAFLLGMPAASAFEWRITLIILPAALLVAGIVAAAGVRALLPRGSGLAASLVVAVSLAASGNAFARGRHLDIEHSGLGELIDHVREMELPRDARLYSLPNQHLVLQWTTGLPVQSIAPVRREFLQGLTADVVLFETTNPWPPVQLAAVRRCSSEAGEQLSDEESSAWTDRLRTRLRREELAGEVEELQPPLEEGLPEWSRCVLEAQRARRADPDYGIDFAAHNPAMFRGSKARDFAGFWPEFFYRFVGPRERSGPGLNYASLLPRASAQVLASGWVVYRCPPPSNVEQPQ